MSDLEKINSIFNAKVDKVRSKEELQKATTKNLLATKVAQVVMDNLEQQGGHSHLLALNNELQGPNGNQHIANLQNSVNTFRRA